MNRRELYLLAVVAVFGLIGLGWLQFARRNTLSDAEKAVIQAQQAQQQLKEAAPVQKVPGELIRLKEHPEAGKPFKFYMAKHSQGPEYILQFPDGSRKVFDGKGELLHTFKRPGGVVVTLFARFEGQEVMLDTMYRRVGQKTVIEDVSGGVNF